MKGISAVIATILLLVITIALAGSAYMFISGIFTAKTAILLDVIDSSCIGEFIQVTVRNDGTSPSGSITVSATDPDGGTTGSCTIASLSPGTTGSCTGSGIDRPATSEAGTYRVVVSATGATTRGTVYCATAGT